MAEKQQAEKQQTYVPPLRRMYLDKIKPEMMQEFQYGTPMQVPRLDKVVISMGVGEAIQNKKALDSAVQELSLIAGQRAVKTKARKSIANFKVRQGYEIGAKVTLRGNRMFEFLGRLIDVALPRVKDFRGVNPNAFDGHGNFSMGVNEQIIFPEIDYDKIDQITGMNIAIVTTAETDQEAKSLLTKFGVPFSK